MTKPLAGDLQIRSTSPAAGPGFDRRNRPAAAHRRHVCLASRVRDVVLGARVCQLSVHRIPPCVACDPMEARGCEVGNPPSWGCLASIHRSGRDAGVGGVWIGPRGMVGGVCAGLTAAGVVRWVGVGPVEAVVASRAVVLGQARAEGRRRSLSRSWVVVKASGGMARRRWSAVRNCVSHGHRAGMRSVTCRAVRVMRPGTVSSRRRSVRAVGMTVSGNPISVVHRSRLCASAAITVQAGVGEELARREVRERLVFEVTDREFHNGVLAVLCLHLLERVGAVGQKRVMAPVGP